MRLQLRKGQDRHGDAARQAAFADLHRDHARDVYNLALRIVGDREDARDISQDVLIKAFERLGKPGELHRRAWLYRVTVNACYDHLRAQRRRPRADGEQAELVSPVDGFEQAALVRSVETALRLLPPAQRAALLLREVHGLPTGEVAYALGTTSDSAAVTLSRARKTFRRHFLDVQAADGVAVAAAVTTPRTRRVADKAGALALGLWLPRLHLPFAPLPAGLESPALLTAASTGATISAAHGDATIGLMARLAEMLCTKAGAVGASATLITGSIGGAYAATHESAAHHHPQPPATQHAAAVHSHKTAAAKVATKASATPRPQVTLAAASTPSASPSAGDSPSATPSGTPTPVTVGETGGTPTPQPTVTITPTATATPTPTASPTATATPTPTPEPSTTDSASPTPQPSPSASL